VARVVLPWFVGRRREGWAGLGEGRAGAQGLQKLRFHAFSMRCRCCCRPSSQNLTLCTSSRRLLPCRRAAGRLLHRGGGITSSPGSSSSCSNGRRVGRRAGRLSPRHARCTPTPAPCARAPPPPHYHPHTHTSGCPAQARGRLTRPSSHPACPVLTHVLLGAAPPRSLYRRVASPPAAVPRLALLYTPPQPFVSTTDGVACLSHDFVVICCHSSACRALRPLPLCQHAAHAPACLPGRLGGACSPLPALLTPKGGASASIRL
jgi:hypothetical protein